MACNLTLSDELAERVGLKDEQGNVRKKITQAEFLSWLSQGNVTALLEEGLLDATKFAKLREKLYTPKEALKAAEKATGKTKNLKQAIRESIRGAVKYVTKTVSAYNKSLLQAEAAGARRGAAYQKNLTKELQKAFREYIKENPLAKIADREKRTRMKTAIEKRAGRITNEKSLAKAIEFYDKLVQDAEYIEKLDALRKAQNRVLRVNKNGLPYTDISFLQTIRQIVPEAVFNVEALTEELDAYANNLRGKAEQVLGIRNRLKEILAQEVELNKLAEAEIQKAKEQFYEGMYNEAVDTGIFSGTLQEYIQFIESPIVTEEALPTQKEPEQEKKERFVKEFIEFFNFLDSEMGLRDIVIGEAQNPTEREQLLKIYEALKNASEETLMNVPTLHLMKMQNILNNIVSEGDFTGFGDMIPQQIAQSEEARKMDWTKFRNIEGSIRIFGKDIYKFGDRAKKGLQVLINSIISGRNTAVNFTNLLFGKAQGEFATAQTALQKLMVEFDRKLERVKDAYKTAIRVDVIGFINQWLPDMTEQEAQAHVRERVARRADDLAEYIQTNTRKDSDQTQKELVSESVEALNYLQDLGAIANLKIDLDAGTVSYDTVDTFVLDVDTLDADTKSVYNFVRDFFDRNTAQVMKNIAIYTGRPAEAWVNYYPTVTLKSFETQNLTSSSSQIFPTVNMYAPVPKQFGTTKQRTGLSGDRNYAIGLRRIFRYGAFQNIVMTDMPYWKNYAYQSTLDSSPIYSYMKKESKLPDRDITYLQTAIKNFVGSKFSHASISKDFGEVGKRILFAMGQGFTRAIIQKPSQVWKQTIPAAVFMAVRSDKYYIKSFKLAALSSKNGLVRQGIERLIASSPEILRTLMGSIELSEKQLQFEKIKSPTGQRMARTAEKVLDGLSKASDFGLTRMADSMTVRTAFTTGYIEYLFKTGKVKNDAELVAHFEGIATGNVVPDSKAMVAATKYQTEVNNASDPDTAPEVMKSDKKFMYFLRYISLTLNQTAVDSMRTAFDSSATADDRIQAARLAAGYVMQAAAFRAVSFGGQYAIVWGLKEMLLQAPDDEEEEKKKLQAKLWSNFGLLVKDIFFGSTNIFTDLVVSMALNTYAEYLIEQEKEQFKKDHPSAKTTPYDWYDANYTKLFGDPQLDDTPTGVMLSAFDQTYQAYDKYSKNVQKYGQEGFNISPLQATGLQLVPFVLGNGALKETSGWYQSAKIRPEDKKVAELSVGKNLPSKDSKEALLQYAKIGINKFSDSYNEQGKRTRFGYNHFVFTPPTSVTLNGTDAEKLIQLSQEQRIVLSGQQAQKWMQINNKLRNHIESIFATMSTEQVLEQIKELNTEAGVKTSNDFNEKILKDISGAKDAYYDALTNKIVYAFSFDDKNESALEFLQDIGFSETEAKNVGNIGKLKIVQAIEK